MSNVPDIRLAPRVLLVEDSLPIRRRLRSLIEESGQARVVGEASTVQGALAQIRNQAPDVVLLDLQLADGTGYTVLEDVKHNQPDCKVIVITNFARPEYRERCALLGADHFLEKSVDFERVPELLGTMGPIDGHEVVFEHPDSTHRPGALAISQSTLDSLPSKVCVLDERGTVVAINQAWRLAAEAAEAPRYLVDKGSSYLAAFERAAAASVDFAEFLAGLHGVLSRRIATFECEYACHAPGELRWFSGRLTRLGDADPPAILAVHTNISPRKLAEMALRESEQRWKLAIEGAGDGVWDTDLRRGLTTYSLRWKEMLGYAEHEIGNSPDEWLTRIHPDDRDRVLAEDRACLSGETTSFSCEFRVRRKDGRWMWVLDRGTVVGRSLDGTPLRMIGTYSDIDARKRADAQRMQLEAQLRESQKMEAVGTLASSISHDFNNIVGAMLGNVALARQDLPADHPALQSLQQIERAGLRARSLVHKILSFARRVPPSMQTQRLQPLVEEGVALLRATLPSGVSLTAELTDTPVYSDVDATQLSQVLMNLGTNAWHSLLGRPGRVEVGLAPVRFEATGSPPPSGLAPGHYAHLWVSDTGCGMDEATRARVFEPFFTTKPEGRGTGLGLPVVHSIVQAHRGAVVIESTVGQGSCFHLYLPGGVDWAADAAIDADLAERLAPSEPADGQHVMYIDDDETIALLVSRLLPRSGFRVTCFQDAQQALDALQVAPQDFDLVVTDLNMPRLSGMDVVRRVAALRADLPVILSSGGLTDDLIESTRQAGVSGWVSKERIFEELGVEALRVLRNKPP